MSAISPTAAERPLPSGPGFLARLMRKPAAVISLTVVAVIVIAVIAAPLLTGGHPDRGDLLAALSGPSAHHLLGTDELGRDILTRLLYGGRPTLLYALEASAVTFTIGLPLGLIAGLYGGMLDRALMALNDIGMSVPVIVVTLLVITVIPSHFWVAMLALGIAVSPPLIRNIRGATLQVRRELFVDAARVSGLSGPRIIVRHILPRIQGAVLVQLTLNCAMSVLFTVSLGFLGFGITAPSPSWGSMTAEAATELGRSPWLLIASGGITGIFVLALSVLGDTIRDTSVEVWATPSPSSARRAGRAPSRAPGGAPAAPTRSPTAVLSMRGVSIAFPRGAEMVTVAQDVDLEVAPGETVGLVGESGCGKTSVARAVLALLRGGGEITAGSIHCDGHDVLSLDPGALRRYRATSVGFISQEPMVALDPCFRVGHQLRAAVRSHASSRASRAQVDARVIELLEQVRLPQPREVMRLYPHELSGGMAQRVAIARALAGSPRLLIADEPTTALDVTVQAEILRLLADLQAQTGMAILLVSHDWSVVSRLCRRAVVMYAGQVVESAPISELLARPAHPYTSGLLDCRPAGVPVGAAQLPVIPGTVPEPGAWPAGCRFAERCPHRQAICTVGAPGLHAVCEDDHVTRCLRAAELTEPERVGV